jgi:hypothetical protein
VLDAGEEEGNRTVHTYHEALADKIFARVADYRDLMRRLYGSIRSLTPSGR